MVGHEYCANPPKPNILTTILVNGIKAWVLLIVLFVVGRILEIGVRQFELVRWGFYFSVVILAIFIVGTFVTAVKGTP